MSHVGILYDERFKLHETGPSHPERPARLDAVAAGLEAAGLLASCVRIDAVEADDEALLRVHSREYLDRLRAACRTGALYIDTPDSGICPASWEIARLAAGGTIEAARRIGRGEIQREFCAVRPPGHHAEAGYSMGFCLFNNVALAARALKDEFGVGRLAILDWDVHHGNGTQHTFELDPDVFFISLHGDPRFLYPGTGYPHESGRGAGAGFTMNLTFAPGTGDAEYRRVFESLVLPTLDGFRPEVLLISAGFDAHADDPLGSLSLSDEMFRWMSVETCRLAGRHAQGRILSVLEGGYNLGVLKRCVAEHVQTLVDEV